jgi:hypothetical protein
MKQSRIQRYLRLPSAYCKSLGGLRWSPSGDCIEYTDGGTFALNQEVTLFLEGFASIRPLLQFCYILHFLKLLRGKEPLMPAPIARLRGAFVEAGRPTRNAGVFFAMLSRKPLDGLEDPQPVTAEEVCERLGDVCRPIRWYHALYHDTFDPLPLASVRPDAFETHFLQVLDQYSREELVQWLRHGRGEVKEAARKLEPEIIPPESLTTTAILERLLSRSRLAGARLYVDHFVSALTLPARRLARELIAVGGYDDVVTHGQPDQILPSQFALDDRDFLRRYAEHELLYFRREIPHTKTRQELIVVLDQGVRTWGDVRLVLTAAVVALAKHAERRGLPFRLAATSSEEGLIDPRETGLENLGEILEASDLSAHPALTLEHVLGQVANRKADVVLLTHARNLREEEVCTVARCIGADVRLFATTLDGEGACALHELKHGHPVKLRQFQVDIQDPSIESRKIEPADSYKPWHGDVERVGYPFRRPSCPILPKFLAFDDTSRWLLAVSAQGLLWAWDLETRTGEMLPRGLLNGRLLAAVEAVLGAADGFVVCGRWFVKGLLCAVHYRCSERKVHVYSLGNSMQKGWEWRNERESNTVAARLGKTGECFTLHLATGSCYSTIDVAAPAADFEPAHTWSATRHSVGSFRFSNSSHPEAFIRIGTDGMLVVLGTKQPWNASFVPLVDGRPVMRDCTLIDAQFSGSTLALKVCGDQPEGRFVLRLYRGPAGTARGAYPVEKQNDPFALSLDARFLGRLESASRMVVHDLTSATDDVIPISEVPGMNVALAGTYLVVSDDSEPPHSHILHWNGMSLGLKSPGADLKTALESALMQHEYPPMVALRDTSGYVPEFARYDKERFLAVYKQHLLILSDRFGQLAILDQSENLTCMVFVDKDQIALWMPDGTVFGPSSMTGRPSTPNALEKIGSALWHASTVTLVKR